MKLTENIGLNTCLGRNFHGNLEFVIKSHIQFIKTLQILIQNMCEKLENTVRAQKTPSDFEFLGVLRCKRCRKEFHRRISCQKQMNYFKTAPKMGLKFVFLK